MEKYKRLFVESDESIGLEIAELLGLKQKSNGRYDMSGGDKTPVGLALTVKRWIDEGLSGDEIATNLNLRKRGGRYETSWGTKTDVGLVATLNRIINEA